MVVVPLALATHSLASSVCRGCVLSVGFGADYEKIFESDEAVFALVLVPGLCLCGLLQPNP